MSELVSVIIPTFNRAYCLARAIDSALAQTHHSLEILVSDDGSTDSTQALIQQKYNREPRLKYLYQENGGVSAARNLGLRAAQGDYIAFLDSDDVWQPWKLQLQVGCLQRLPAAGMVWTDMTAVDPEGHIRSPRYLRTMYDAYRWFTPEQLFSESHALADLGLQLAEVESSRVYLGDIYSPMIMGNLVHTSTVLLRRERFEKVQGFNETLALAGEDYDFHLRTCREGPVAFLDLPAIQYQVDGADRLSRFSYQIAQNFLTTVTTALARDRDRITLPRSMRNAVLAEAHCWVGEEQLAASLIPEARRSFGRSLWYQFWQPRLLALWGLSWLPGWAFQSLRDLQRRVRGSFTSEPALCPPPDRTALEKE